MSSTDTIQLEGSHEQVSELLRAVSGFKTILFSLGGDSQPMDSVLEGRISKLNYWEELLSAKISQ